MSLLSEEKINNIAAKMPQGFLWSEGCSWESGILIQEAIDFARAIEAAVLEAQSGQKPVADLCFMCRGTGWHQMPYAGLVKPDHLPAVKCAQCDYHKQKAAPVVQPCPCNGEGCYNCDAWDKQSVIAAAEGKK